VRTASLTGSIGRYFTVFALCLGGILTGATSCVEERSTPADDPGRAPTLGVLSPAFADTLARLGYADQIVGRHRFDSAREALPALGDNFAVDYETLARVSPDVLIMESNAAATPERLRSVADRLGMAIVRVPSLGLDEVRDSIGALDAIAMSGAGWEQAEEMSERAASLVESFDASMRPLDPGVLEDAGRVVAVMGPEAVLGPGSFHQQMLSRMGLDVAPTDGEAYMRVGIEDLAAMANSPAR